MGCGIDIIMTGRPDLVDMAAAEGYLVGSRLDKVPEHDEYGSTLEFIDLDWKNPEPDRLAAACDRHRPRYAVAGDYDGTNHATVNQRARRLRDYCENVVVVPHEPGDIQAVPEWAVVGYSVPTDYAETSIPLRRYMAADQPVHILGGTPHQQLDILGRLWTDTVVSMDCNSHHKAATRGAKAWHRVYPRWRKVPEGTDRVERAYETSVSNLKIEHEARGIA